VNEPKARRNGRPHCGVAAFEIARLRDAGGSFREIGRALGIGASTAQRLYIAYCCVPKPFQNSANTSVEGMTATNPVAPSETAGALGTGLLDSKATPVVYSEPGVASVRAVLGVCAVCGQSRWRKRGDGSPICAACRPLPPVR
jgi:hypothetical protein